MYTFSKKNTFSLSIYIILIMLGVDVLLNAPIAIVDFKHVAYTLLLFLFLGLFLLSTFLHFKRLFLSPRLQTVRLTPMQERGLIWWLAMAMSAYHSRKKKTHIDFHRWILINRIVAFAWKRYNWRIQREWKKSIEKLDV